MKELLYAADLSFDNHRLFYIKHRLDFDMSYSFTCSILKVDFFVQHPVQHVPGEDERPERHPRRSSEEKTKNNSSLQRRPGAKIILLETY
jgi:hypothetical protein